MNEVIKALYEIEEQAGELMDKANISRQTMQEEKNVRWRKSVQSWKQKWKAGLPF